jgi:hypothetical protein
MQVIVLSFESFHWTNLRWQLESLEDTFNAVCFRSKSFALNITAVIHTETIKPVMSTRRKSGVDLQLFAIPGPPGLHVFFVIAHN